MEQNDEFLGRGWEFPPSFECHSKSVEMVSGVVDIKQSLRLLLTTMPGERSMELEYGTDLTPLAFQPLDLNLKTFMVSNIKQAITDFEKRITVNEVHIAMENAVEGTIRIAVNYMVKGTSELDSFSYDYNPES